jgi:hypothetical protein
MTGEVYILNPYGNISAMLDVPALLDPDHQLEIDTSDLEMGTAWQQTLNQLQAKLDALERDFPDPHVAQEHDHDAGMGY